MSDAKEISILKQQLDELKLEVQKLKYSSHENYSRIKKCKCEDPVYSKTETITKYVGKDMDKMITVVAYVCKCKGHYVCFHVCQMYHCNEKVECGYTFCQSCFDKTCKKKKYEQTRQTCCRCKAIANPFVEPEGSFCSEHCKTLVSYYG